MVIVVSETWEVPRLIDTEKKVQANSADCSAVARWRHKKTSEKMRQRYHDLKREQPSPVPLSSQEHVLEESLIDEARARAAAWERFQADGVSS